MRIKLSLNHLFILLIAVLLLTACSLNSIINPNPQEPGSISGRLYLDENSNQECDCECGLEAIKVRLFRETCSGGFIETAITNQEGYFSFVNLPAGEYCVFPEISFSCEGFFPTDGINRSVTVKPGENLTVEWFSYETYVSLDGDD